MEDKLISTSTKSFTDRLLFVFKCASVLHLIFVVFGAIRVVPFSQDSAVGRVITLYRAYTGADNSYGFFAPGVSSSRRVILHGYHNEQNEWINVLEDWQGKEARLRLSTVSGLFTQSDHPDILAASWAAWMFGQYPHLSPVIVEDQAYLIPTMKNFRNGERPRWQAIGAFTFVQKGDGDNAR